MPIGVSLFYMKEDYMKSCYQQEVYRRIERRPYLLPIFDHVFDIPKRVYEYDHSFFVVFNKNSQKYEIHSLDYPGEQTHSCSIPYPELDERALHHLWENDIRVHGEEIFKRIEISEEKARIRAEREQKNFRKDFAIEHQSAFSKDAWLM
jgi:hypothetical protein